MEAQNAVASAVFAYMFSGVAATFAYGEDLSQQWTGWVRVLCDWKTLPRGRALCGFRSFHYGETHVAPHRSFGDKKERVVFFRLEENAKRFNSSSSRLCIPEIPNEIFINAVKNTVKDNLDYMPKKNKGSIYIRPLAFGVSPTLGVKPADHYTFLVFVTPVGSYFKSGLDHLNVLVTNEYHRAATKSIGSAKAIGNYSGTLLPFSEISSAGYDEIIFLNSSNEGIIDEARSANIFIVKDEV